MKKITIININHVVNSLLKSKAVHLSETQRDQLEKIKKDLLHLKDDSKPRSQSKKNSRKKKKNNRTIGQKLKQIILRLGKIVGFLTYFKDWYDKHFPS